MKLLDDLNQRIDTIRHSVEQSEPIVAGIRKELEESELRVRRLAQGNGTARWMEGGLIAAGVIGLLAATLFRADLQSRSAIILALIVLVTFFVEIAGDGQRRTAAHARNNLASSLEQRLSILENRRAQLEARTRERDRVLGIVEKTKQLKTPYIANFVARYRLGTAAQRQSLKELLEKQLGLELDEPLLLDLLEDTQDAMEYASLVGVLSDPDLKSRDDHLRGFIAHYRRKGNKAHLLRLLKERGLVDQGFTAELLDEALAQREHDMKIDDFGVSLEGVQGIS